MRFIVQINELSSTSSQQTDSKDKNKKHKRETTSRKLCSVVTSADDELEAIKKVSKLKRNEYMKLFRESKVLQYKILQKDYQDET